MAIKTILCIEDDRFIGEMYVRSLQKAGYAVDWVVDGNDGLVAARNKPYDLIIIDIMLPERRGDQILDALRNDTSDLVPDSKIIIMTVKIVEATIPIVEKIFFSFLLEIIANINAIISNINAIIIPKFEYSIHPIINNKKISCLFKSIYTKAFYILLLQSH